jgi:hypothetical protein
MVGGISNGNGNKNRYGNYSGKGKPTGNNNSTAGGINKNKLFSQPALNLGGINRHGNQNVGETGDSYSSPSSNHSEENLITIYRRDPFYFMSPSSWRRNFPETSPSTQVKVPPTQKKVNVGCWLFTKKSTQENDSDTKYSDTKYSYPKYSDLTDEERKIEDEYFEGYPASLRDGPGGEYWRRRLWSPKKKAVSFTSSQKAEDDEFWRKWKTRGPL